MKKIIAASIMLWSSITFANWSSHVETDIMTDQQSTWVSNQGEGQSISIFKETPQVVVGDKKTMGGWWMTYNESEYILLRGGKFTIRVDNNKPIVMDIGLSAYKGQVVSTIQDWQAYTSDETGGVFLGTQVFSHILWSDNDVKMCSGMFKQFMTGEKLKIRFDTETGVVGGPKYIDLVLDLTSFQTAILDAYGDIGVRCFNDAKDL